jgi:hypothetical protein
MAEVLGNLHLVRMFLNNEIVMLDSSVKKPSSIPSLEHETLGTYSTFIFSIQYQKSLTLSFISRNHSVRIYYTGPVKLRSLLFAGEQVLPGVIGNFQASGY